MRKELIVLQDGFKDCGSACLLSIIRYYGGDIPLSNLVELTNTTRNGTNLLELKKVAKSIGLDAVGYKVSEISKLHEIDRPFIAQLNISNKTHFVVVYKIKEDKILMMDPSKGKVLMDIFEFTNLWTSYIMIFIPYRKLSIYSSLKEVNKIILSLILNNKKLILDIFIISLIFTISSCILTYYFQILTNDNYNNIYLITFIFVIILFYKIISNYFRNKLLIYLTQKLDLSLMMITYNKLLLLPYNYYKNKTTGEIISRINDINIIKSSLSKLIITVFLDGLIFITSGIILYCINYKLFIFLLIISLIYLIIVLLTKNIIKKLINNIQVDNSRVSTFLVETLTNFETIKGLNIHLKQSKKYENIYLNTLNDNYMYLKLNNIINFFKELLNGITNIFILFIGIKLYLNEELSIQTLITFNYLYPYFTNYLNNLFDLYNEYSYMSNSIKRLNNLFDVESISLDKSNLIVTGDIIFNNVSFKYTDKLILNNISFKIKDKEKVLLIGSSGTGKSTILKLLFKYYQIERNYISINNNDINDYKIMDIRSNVVYISQNEKLFNDTIKSNIILDSNVSEEEFLNVVKLTKTDEIIKDDLLGYNKIIEEDAINLSGGQRQKIILSRALLRKSKIILIDEGLNQIDIFAERIILKNIFKYYKDTTFIIVSHRLNNMDLFDKVLSLENNNINVLERNDSYYE